MSKDARIAALEAKMHTLEKSHDEVSRKLTEAKREQWQARVDDLELQAHLSAMEADDRVQARMEQMRTKWNEARAQMGEASSTAEDIKDTLWSGMENAVHEVRHALMESKKKLS